MRSERKTLDFCARLAISLCDCIGGWGVTSGVAWGYAASLVAIPVRFRAFGARLGDPLAGDGVLGAAVAAAAAGVEVGPAVPVFLVEELDEDSFGVRAWGAAKRGDDGVLLGAVGDAIDEHGKVGAKKWEVDAEFAEGCGFAGLRDGRWNLVAGDGGGFECFALVGVFAGGGDGVDEGVAVGDDQAADDVCRDVVLAQIAFLNLRTTSQFHGTTVSSRTTIEMDARRECPVSP
jgi:hypothetical protein